MVYRTPVSEIYISVQGYLEDVEDDDYEKLQAIRTYLSDLRSRSKLTIEVREFEKQIRDMDSEYLALMKAFTTYDWYTVREISEEADLGREVVIRHMLRFSSVLYPSIFEHIRVIPNYTRERRGQGWRVFDGMLPALKEIIAQASQVEQKSEIKTA